MLTFIEICLLLMMGACLCALVFYIFRDMAKDRKAKQEWQPPKKTTETNSPVAWASCKEAKTCNRFICKALEGGLQSRRASANPE